jgi:cytochrome bd-type quinol oxidase subunit 1
MEFLHAAIAMLASMVFVLAGMVGYIYWQQTRMFQNVNTLSLVLGDIAQTVVAARHEAHVEHVHEPAPESVQAADIPTSEEEDDRVAPEAEVVEGPPEPLDLDALQDKTKKELHEILTKRGIPFSKSDGKTALISLLKATA